MRTIRFVIDPVERTVTIGEGDDERVIAAPRMRRSDDLWSLALIVAAMVNVAIATSNLRDGSTVGMWFAIALNVPAAALCMWRSVASSREARMRDGLGALTQGVYFASEALAGILREGDDG